MSNLHVNGAHQPRGLGAGVSLHGASEKLARELRVAIRCLQHGPRLARIDLSVSMCTPCTTSATPGSKLSTYLQVQFLSPCAAPALCKDCGAHQLINSSSTDAKEEGAVQLCLHWNVLMALAMGWKGAQAQGATCQTRDTLQLPGCAHTPCWNSSRARARLPARASSTPHVCAEHSCSSLHSLGEASCRREGGLGCPSASQVTSHSARLTFLDFPHCGVLCKSCTASPG